MHLIFARLHHVANTHMCKRGKPHSFHNGALLIRSLAGWALAELLILATATAILPIVLLAHPVACRTCQL